ncbi:hypothetical protein NLU13_8704 [Sarocladium strictum]|uniref:DNA (cytosine-5-)-methyltransferase n=1 Tax=Sarocladium strictum TaxID=5046 RepID=A0AA39L582_SARSR|nr:hypothetical protein NLU13_8704 [Sarocladium strictum]
MDEDPADIFGIGALPDELSFFVDNSDDVSFHWPASHDIPQDAVSENPGAVCECAEDFEKQVISRYDLAPFTALDTSLNEHQPTREAVLASSAPGIPEFLEADASHVKNSPTIETDSKAELHHDMESVIQDVTFINRPCEASVNGRREDILEHRQDSLVNKGDLRVDEDAEVVAEDIPELLATKTCRIHAESTGSTSRSTPSDRLSSPPQRSIDELSTAANHVAESTGDDPRKQPARPPDKVPRPTVVKLPPCDSEDEDERPVASAVPSVPAHEELVLPDEEECFGNETELSASEASFASETTPPSPPSSTGTISTPYKEPWPCPLQSNIAVELPTSTLISPPSHYEPFTPPAPESAEWRAVDALCRESRRLGLTKDGYVEFDLNDFAVYVDAAHYPDEMRSLHFLDTRAGHSKYYFDGTLSVGELRFFVRRVPIAALPIDGYLDPDVHTVRGLTWLHSAHNAKRQLYYKLRKPAKEYARFYEPFVWVADLAKHVVDFLDAMQERGDKVSIHSFKHDFGVWLLRRHDGAQQLLRWGRQHPSGDFRTSVAAHVGFLYKEAYGVLGPKKVDFHPLWDEILRFTRFQQEPAAQVENDPTIVTEYIRDCFAHLPFGDRLESIPFSEETKRLRRRLIRKRRLEMPAPLHDGISGLSNAASERIRRIRPGDTISTDRDDVGSGTMWKREVARGSHDVDRWFARVQRVSTNRRGQRVFDVIWYYRPVDTLCGVMKYPWSNEIFLSDHCSCEETSKITEDQVLGVHDVQFWGSSATSKELFCRQTYIAGERKWITLEKKHLHCAHVSVDMCDNDEPPYRIGDTVLLHLNLRTDRSEPCEIVDLEPGSQEIQVRRLLRRGDVDQMAATAPPNELVWSEELLYSKRARITSKCHVRFFKDGGDIPTPYDHNGVGAFFFITHQLFRDGRCRPLTARPPSLRQGFDPYQTLPRLRGLDLFCGGGNFGRGLEDGGAIEMRWLNDYNQRAVHTYMANVANPETIHPFVGSIDDMQRQAMLGNFSEKVPKIGDVDFISAGSPCPGFSNLTNDKTTVQQRKNQSLVAAFGSFVDLYRPQYGLLENVRGIVQKKANRDQDVFSQLICAIVGLGYQTRFFFLDASSCGSAQARPRVFLAFAAPGCRLPNKPQITHSHPPGAKSLSLGLLPNGEAMAEREMPATTPFKFVSASEACADLPAVYDAKPDTCIPFPDHRVAIGTTRDLRLQMSLIPTQPWGMNFALAWYGMDKKKAGSGIFTQAERDLFPADKGQRTVGRTLASSSAYGRLLPHRPFNTIVTQQSPGDAKNGQQMHWREPRTITLMEARRAQGFRDHEVLLGSVRDQYKVVGNSVAREVAVALGLMFREAEFGSLTDGEEDLSRLTGVDTGDDVPSPDEEVYPDAFPVVGAKGSSSVTTAASSLRSTPATAVKRSSSASSLVVEIPTAKRPRHDPVPSADDRPLNLLEEM